MLSRWQHEWRVKVSKSTRWYLCLALAVCFTQTMTFHATKLSILSSVTRTGRSVMAQTLSENQLFKKLIERAAAAYKRERFKEATQYFERAMVLNPNPNIYWNLAACYYKIADYPKALANANAYLKNGSPSEKMRRKVEAKKKDILYHLQKAYLSPKVKPAGKPSIRSSKDTLRSPRPNEAEVKVNSQTLDMFEMSSPTTQLGDSKFSPNQQQNLSYRSAHSSRRSLVIWGSVAGALLASSIGLHLYGDHIWDSRPQGGGILAQDKRREALLVSWVGDGMLALSLTSLIIGIISYTDHMEESETTSNIQVSPSHASSGIGQVSFTLLQSQNSRQSKADGGLLGWRFNF